ncbi:hypothetical protein Lalb_Chr22g0354231 [Lupinus albus]|uniref:Uncharacterized protein n=1 Tax=Lupinus albus TaxID=3870 RepID=A0A6A4NFW4_LUPAL|nr:hypothetical protein Lalb_Chr22g0354231 [Lupinus albus]
MASTSILLCCGLGAVISSTYSVKKALNDSILGAQGEFTLALKFATLFTIFLFPFLFHAPSVMFLTHVLSMATIFSIVGYLPFYFGPVMPFLCSIAMLLLLHELDFVERKDHKGENVCGK